VIDHETPWAFFYEASQDDRAKNEGGVVLHLKNSHSFNLKMGLEQGSNNYVELMALKLLITFAGEKGIKSIHIFGDSMTIINWVNKSQQCHTIRLRPILEYIFFILGSFDSLSV